MSNGIRETEQDLPLHSKHGVIMKSSAFLDPKTQQISWCIANKTISGDWKIQEFKTELFPGKDPVVEPDPYKSDKPLGYGDAIRTLVDYERIRIDSGMLNLTDDYPTTKNIPHYRDVAHSDGIIFDKQGNPHPTLNGHVITKGKFATSEMMAVLDAIQKPEKGTELSAAFAQTQNIAETDTPEKIIASKSIEQVIGFISSVFDVMKTIHDVSDIYYYSCRKSFHFDQSRYGIDLKLKHGGNHIETAFHAYDNHGNEYCFYQNKFIKGLNAVYNIIEKDSSFLPGDVKAEIKEFIYGLNILLSSQIIHSLIVDDKKEHINGRVRGGALSDISEVVSQALETEKNMLATHIKTYGGKKLSKQELKNNVDRIVSAALHKDFPDHISEARKIGDILIDKLSNLGQIPMSQRKRLQLTLAPQ